MDTNKGTAIPTHQYRHLGNGVYVLEPICVCYTAERSTGGNIYCPMHEEMWKYAGILKPVNKVNV